MAEAIAERVRRYILDGSDADLRRLLGVAETTREMARSTFRTAPSMASRGLRVAQRASQMRGAGHV